jgi:hypothetical protein
MDFYKGRLLLAMGADGLVEVNGGVASTVAYLAGSARGVAGDAANDLVYYAAGEGGLYVLGDPTTATPYEVLGQFTPPTVGVFHALFDVKDVTVEDEEVFLANGVGGVFFITKD